MATATAHLRARFNALFGGALRRTTTLTFGLRLINVGLGFVASVALARLLGVEGFGLYSFALAVITMLAVPAQFGIPALLIRDVSRARADGKPERIFDLSRWAHRLSLVISIPLLAVTLVASVVPNPLVSTMEAQLLIVGSVLIIILPVRAIVSGLIRGWDRVVLGQFPGQVIQPLVFLLGIGILGFTPILSGLTNGLNSASAMAAYSVSVIMAWVCGLLILRRLLAHLPRMSGERYVIPWWRSSLIPFGLTNAMVLVDQQIGILVLGAVSADSQVAFYKVAGQAATFTAMGYVAANMALGPGVAKAWREGKRSQVQSAVIRGSQLSTLFAFPIMMFFLVAGGVFLNLLFGEEYLPAWPAMILLVIAQFVNCAFGSSTTLLNMSDNETANTKAFAIALAVNVALSFALAPTYGSTGAAVAAAASIILRNLMLWRAAHRLTGMETGFWGRLPKTNG